MVIVIWFFSKGFCNFDKRSLCTWTNRKDDDFDWTIQHNGTPSRGTGPTRDHTLGTSSGYYVYIETSRPRTTGHKAYLQSATFPANNNNPQCFKFWYSMNGNTIGMLNVYIATNVTTASATKTKLWTLKGKQGPAWHAGQFTAQSSTEFQVSIF